MKFTESSNLHKPLEDEAVIFDEEFVEFLVSSAIDSCFVVILFSILLQR